ncbi:hypothetical protein P5673_018960 [Acropora cervicornis]|uniref:Uncharacterized protein n=1 Tax=Acropora cervicornis TaxID=6130 RepID=A0AAD9V2H5_ACRCE|nr:hypothetical protein P5673_018960 [Acropora cervicornis]
MKSGNKRSEKMLWSRIECFSGETSETSEKPNLSSDDRSTYSWALAFSDEFMQRTEYLKATVFLFSTSQQAILNTFTCKEMKNDEKENGDWRES